MTPNNDKTRGAGRGQYPGKGYYPMTPSNEKVSPTTDKSGRVTKSSRKLKYNSQKPHERLSGFSQELTKKEIDERLRVAARKPPPPAPGTSNGREKDRKLINWNDPTVDQLLLLTLQYECFRNRIELPWEQIAYRMACEKNSTPTSITQHLSKLRTKMFSQGIWVPPQMGKNPLPEYHDVRGIVKTGPSPDEWRHVSWFEDPSHMISKTDIERSHNGNKCSHLRPGIIDDSAPTMKELCNVESGKYHQDFESTEKSENTLKKLAPSFGESEFEGVAEDSASESDEGHRPFPVFNAEFSSRRETMNFQETSANVKDKTVVHETVKKRDSTRLAGNTANRMQKVAVLQLNSDKLTAYPAGFSGGQDRQYNSGEYIRTSVNTKAIDAKGKPIKETFMTTAMKMELEGVNAEDYSTFHDNSEINNPGLTSSSITKNNTRRNSQKSFTDIGDHPGDDRDNNKDISPYAKTRHWTNETFPRTTTLDEMHRRDDDPFPASRIPGLLNSSNQNSHVDFSSKAMTNNDFGKFVTPKDITRVGRNMGPYQDMPGYKDPEKNYSSIGNNVNFDKINHMGQSGSNLPDHRPMSFYEHGFTQRDYQNQHVQRAKTYANSDSMNMAGDETNFSSYDSTIVNPPDSFRHSIDQFEGNAQELYRQQQYVSETANDGQSVEPMISNTGEDTGIEDLDDFMNKYIQFPESP